MPNNDPDLALQIGRLEGRMDALTGRVDRRDVELREINAKLDLIAERLAERLGERTTYGHFIRAAMWLGGLLSGWLYAYSHHVFGAPPPH